MKGVELGSIFDTFFFKVQRKPNQSLLDYVTDFHQALRDVQRLKVDLPEEITGWLMLRRAALAKDQQHLVQSQVGKTLTTGKRGAKPFPGFWSRLQAIQSSKSPWKIIP